MEENRLRTIARAYRTAERRLLLMDFDGTLAPISHLPLNQRTWEFGGLIADLTSDSKNEVIIISGRIKQDLDSIFYEQIVTLVAEHGAFVKHNNGVWHETGSYDYAWVQKMHEPLSMLTSRFPGSFLEVKNFSVVWNYNSVTLDVDLNMVLKYISNWKHFGFSTYLEFRSIELRSPSITKGAFVDAWMEGKDYDFLIALGDGQTDEDLFKSIRKGGWTVRVGRCPQSIATDYLDSQENVIPFLVDLYGSELE